MYIDIEKALADGIRFYLSTNGVVLCPGNEFGFLEPKYFQRVESGENAGTCAWGGSAARGVDIFYNLSMPTWLRARIELVVAGSNVSLP
ncbi:hypothetical protein FB446DRAFT_743448 [Lentinula raphanica]|nr:hypothetical protein FB446DRAFT_743448 [Lentinula raphanica]